MTVQSMFGIMKARRWIAALGLLVITIPAGAQCPLSLAPAVNYSVGIDPSSVAVGDFNADGNPDLAVANPGSNNVSILLGNANGNGTFPATGTVAAGNFPLFVAVGDFNADGKPDLAVANFSSNNVSILLGTGTGTFNASTNLPLGTNPFSVAVGDFNADGRPDLAVVNANSNNVSILLGNGNGTFQPPVNYAVGGIPNSIAVGDFNADGRPDLAVANDISNTVSILLGNANGTFLPAVTYAVGSAPASVAVGDFNADGRPDLAVANFLSNNVSILLGNGPPSIGTFQAAVPYLVGTRPLSVAVGDFNSDGRPDLGVANNIGNDLAILLGNGNGTFQVADDFLVGDLPFSVAVGDFNSDGRPDLAVVNNRFTSQNVSVLLNTTPSPVVFQQPTPVSTCATGTATFSVTAAGTGPFTFRWQWQPTSGAAFVNVIDGLNTDPQGGPISFVAAGATTASVTAGSFAGTGTDGSHWDTRCIVSNTCGSVASNPATLTIDPCGPVACALADVASDSLDTTRNPNNAIGPEDLDAFIAAFIADNVSIADVASDSLDTTYNPNNSVGPEDLDAFIASFIAGC